MSEIREKSFAKVWSPAAVEAGTEVPPFLSTPSDSFTPGPGPPVGSLPPFSPVEPTLVPPKPSQRSSEDLAGDRIHELFEAQVQRTPDAIALVSGGRRLSYAELNSRADRLASGLQDLGVGPEILVAVCLERSLEMVIAVLAVLKAGGAYLPVDPAFPPERIRFMLEDGAARVALTETSLRSRLPRKGVHVICLDRGEGPTGSRLRPRVPVAAGPENLAYVIYTSGSTGNPKGVAITHRNLVNYTAFMVRRLGLASLGPGVAFATVSTIAADLGNTCLFPSLVSGGSLHVIPYEVATDGDRFAEYLSNNPIDVLKIVPSHFLGLLNGWDAGRICPRRFLIFGGEALTGSLLRRVQEKSDCIIINHYGPTETTVGALTFDVPRIADPEEPIPIGRPIDNARILILDDRFQPVALGAIGELYIGGAGVARGYLNRDDLTSKRFLPDPSGGDGRIYRTGDLARYRTDGNVEFHGRVDHQVKIHGFRVELGEIQATLGSRRDVREAVVLVREDERGEGKLVAYVVAGREPVPRAEELRAFLREKLPEYMVPSSFIFLGKLPLTSNGKVDRKALPLPEARTFSRESFLPPRDALEIKLAEIWERVLGVRPIGARDDFFELGGHSLNAGRLFTSVRRIFGQDLSPSELLGASTIEKLAERLRQGTTPRPWTSLVPIQTGGRRPALFCIHAGAGTILFYNDLARHLGPVQPVYGLQAQGVYGRASPHATVEEMAAHYIREIRTAQPEGPYHLAGFCFGAVVAFEMAHQLRHAGFEVGLLASFDGGRPGFDYRSVKRRRLPLPEPRSRREWLLFHLAHVRLFGPGYVSEKIADRWIRFWRMHSYRFGRRRAEQDRPLPAIVRRSFFLYNHAFAEHAYRPRPYPGKMVIFETRNLFLEPKLGWEKLVTGGVEVHEISGDHKLHRDLMAGKFVIGLVDLLRKYLGEAEPGAREALETPAVSHRVSPTSSRLETIGNQD